MDFTNDAFRNVNWMTYLLILVFGLGSALSFIYGEPVCEAAYVSILFALPLLVFFLATHFKMTDGESREGNSPRQDFPGQRFSGSLLFVLYLGWIAWSLHAKSVEEGEGWSLLHWLGSWGFLLAACSLMFAVVRLTWRLTAPDSLRLKKHLQVNGITAILFFVALFIIVTYLLAFSLAFHDRLQEGPQLYAAGAPSMYLSPGIEREQDLGESQVEDRAVSNGSWWFAFEDGKATVEMDADLLDFPLERLQADHEGNDDIKQMILREWSNIHALEDAANFILDRDDYERLQVTLRGHASDTPLKDVNGKVPDYRSNYELSLARVKQVEQHLREKLIAKDRERKEAARWHNLEWVLIPLSNEGDPTPDSDLFGDGEWLNKRTTVEVRVAEIPHASQAQSQIALGRPMGLLDYVYFTIYTITTTGYGDIVPVSSFSKLVTSIANLFELFFLVVFLNILLNVMFERYRLGAEASRPGPRPVESAEVREGAR